MDITILLMLVGLLTFAIDGILWGFAGNIAFRYMGGDQSKWPIGAFFTWLAYFAWDQISGTVFSNIGMSFDNQEVTDFIGEDIFSFDLIDVAISIAVIIGCFKITQKIINKVFFSNENNNQY